MSDLLLLQQEVLGVVHAVVVRVLYPDPPRLREPAMELVVPLKLWGDGQTYS